MSATATSKGRLFHPGGMNMDVLDSHEFEGVNRYWYRVELYREGVSPAIKAAYYRRERGTWIPFAGNQACAMERRRMLSLYGEVDK